MRKLILLVLVVAAGYYAITSQQQAVSVAKLSAADRSVANRPAAIESNDALNRAIDLQQSKVQVRASGVVDRILSDDTEGSKHQRFVVKLKSGQTVLIAHNIDLAPRVSPLNIGDEIQFNGEYEWNSKGGVVHWTHRDPAGKHQAGWIRREGRTFE